MLHGWFVALQSCVWSEPYNAHRITLTERTRTRWSIRSNLFFSRNMHQIGHGGNCPGCVIGAFIPPCHSHIIASAPMRLTSSEHQRSKPTTTRFVHRPLYRLRIRWTVHDVWLGEVELSCNKIFATASVRNLTSRGGQFPGVNLDPAPVFWE